MNQLRIWLQKPAGILGLGFLLLFAVNLGHGGGTNPASRFASIRAMSLNHSFRINPYAGWTEDWSRTPDGNYYSNKAPGPALLAFPLAWALDRIHAPTSPLEEPGLLYKSIFSFLFQMLPFFWLSILSIQVLAETGVSPRGQLFAALALFFGNTSVFFMSIYFGHGMAACFLLALFLSTHRRHYFWAGMSLGWALLTDYGCALLIAPFLIVFFRENRSVFFKNASWVALGGLLPGLLWILYHTLCFGNPWTIGQNFQNPAFVQNTAQYGELSSVIGWLPQPSRIIQLLFGPVRGILFTQPWMLFIIPGALYLRPRNMPPVLLWLGVVGLFELLWMNAGFSGWHGGGSPGPRYLCMVFPLLCLVAGYVFDAVSALLKHSMQAALGVTILLSALIYSGEVCAPPTEPIWSYYGGSLLRHFPGHPLISLIAFLGVVGRVTWLAVQKTRVRFAST